MQLLRSDRTPRNGLSAHSRQAHLAGSRLYFGWVRRAMRTCIPSHGAPGPKPRATAARFTVSRAPLPPYRRAALNDQRMPVARRELGRWRARSRRIWAAMTRLYQAGITPPPARRVEGSLRDHRHGVESPGRRVNACPLRELPSIVVQGRAQRHLGRDRDQMPTLRRLQFNEATEPFTDRQPSGAEEPTLWTYLPHSPRNRVISEGFLSVPAMPASISASTSPSQDIGLWVSSSGTATRRPLSWRGWRTRPWLRRLSGTISDPSMASRGAGAFISSLPVIPASPSAMRESEEATPTLVTCGQTSPASSEKSSPNGSSARMSKGTCLWDLPTSPATFDAWATRQRQACSRREKRALATAGAGSSSWPTPTASDAGYFPDLTIANGAVATVAPMDISEGSCGQFSLTNSARIWASLWMVLKAVGWSAALATPPSSHPVRVSFKHGNTSFVSGLISNPQFFEMVMGWPIGWTAPERPVTAFAAWLQRSRGRFSNLLSDFDDGATEGRAAAL